ncbi:MAG TPA: CHAD domain-containing protein [Dokdonella sp.]|nr:CHAD domain-containing protein [Dokdonella sp.]
MAAAKAVRDEAAAGLGVGLYALAAADLAVLAEALADGTAPHRGVHEARKAIRRLRAILRLGHRRLGPRAATADAALAHLADGLSDLRDAQVLVDLAGRHLREARDEDERRCRAALRRQLLAERRAVLARVRARDPGFAARRAEVARIGRIVERLPWARLDADDLERALARSQRRAERAGERARRAGADAERRHRWRRRLRRLRMQWSALKTLRKRERDDAGRRALAALLAGLRRRSGAFRALAATVDVLGAEQDRRLLEAVLARPQPAGAAAVPAGVAR